MKEISGRKVSINIPLDWALNQIIYSYDEGTSKSDIIAMAIRHNKGKVIAEYFSSKLCDEYPDMSVKEMIAPELTESGRRSMLHVNIPVELSGNLTQVAEKSGMSINRAVISMVHKIYDGGIAVVNTPRARQAGTMEVVRIAINFPISLIEKTNDLTENPLEFRATVIKALEEYLGRSLNGGEGSTKSMGTQ